MHVHPYTSATFALVTFWAVGVATTVAVADTEVGLIRDHPLYGRRLCSLVVPPLAVTGLLTPLFVNAHLRSLPPYWVLLSIPLMLPFAWLSWVWSRTWIIRTSAQRRRRLGIVTVTAGIVGTLLSSNLALGDMEPTWRTVLPMGIFVSTAALLGSLTNFSLLALTEKLPSEVPGGPAKNLASVAGFGLLTTLLVGGDMVAAYMQGLGWPAEAGMLMWVWLICSLAIPGVLLLSRLFSKHMPDTLIMTVALFSAVVGQFAGLVLIFAYPGLVPPIIFEPQ